MSAFDTEEKLKSCFSKMIDLAKQINSSDSSDVEKLKKLEEWQSTGLQLGADSPVFEAIFAEFKRSQASIFKEFETLADAFRLSMTSKIDALDPKIVNISKELDMQGEMMRKLCMQLLAKNEKKDAMITVVDVLTLENFIMDNFDNFLENSTFIFFAGWYATSSEKITNNIQILLDLDRTLGRISRKCEEKGKKFRMGKVIPIVADSAGLISEKSNTIKMTCENVANSSRPHVLVFVACCSDIHNVQAFTPILRSAGLLPILHTTFANPAYHICRRGSHITSYRSDPETSDSESESESDSETDDEIPGIMQFDFIHVHDHFYTNLSRDQQVNKRS